MADREPIKDGDFPEHEKLHKVKDESQRLGDFLEWLGSNGVELCSLKRTGRTFSGADSEYPPIRKDISALLAEYFEIDLKKLEKEKRQMLGMLRLAHESLTQCYVRHELAHADGWTHPEGDSSCGPAVE